MSLSVVINTKNAAKTVEKTLKSVKFADEIIVVDMQSDDDTVKIAKKYTEKIFAHDDVGYVEPARNFAIKKASHEWILIVDADEEVPKQLQKEIKKIVSDTASADCYYLPRKNMIFNKAITQTGWWPDYVLRLFRDGHVSWSDEIHSIPITTGKVVELPATENLALIHHNYQSIEQFVSRMNRYSGIQAQEIDPESFDAATGPFIVKKFYSEFLARFFAQNGVADGTHGLALSFLQGFSEVLVALKVWQTAQFPESDRSQEAETVAELSQFNRELAYWIADWNVQNSSGFKQLIWKIRRKLYI